MPTSSPAESTTRFGMVHATVLARSDVTDGELRVYAALAAHADRAGRCYPGIETLCRESGGKHRRTVERALGSLAQKGLIRIEHRLGRSSIYTLTEIESARKAAVDKCGTSAATPPAPAPSPSRHQHRGNTPPNIYKKSYEKFGSEKAAGNVGGMPLARGDNTEWDVKVSLYQPGKPWSWGAFSGPRPDESGCYAPPEILKKYGYACPRSPQTVTAPVA